MYLHFSSKYLNRPVLSYCVKDNKTINHMNNFVDFKFTELFFAMKVPLNNEHKWHMVYCQTSCGLLLLQYYILVG